MSTAPILLEGNEAVAEGAIAAGARFFAGYPITPSTEIAETLASRLPEVGGRFIQMEYEIASVAAICGASLAGQKSLIATSGPGFSLMQEMLGFASMAQVPCVIVDVMRGGPSTGLPTDPSQGDVMQARWGTHGEHSVIALVPDLGRYLREKIYHHRDAIVKVEEFAMEGAEVAIFAYGSVACSARAVVVWARAQGVAVGLVRPITLWPFPTAAVDRMAGQVRTVIVPEMNLKQMSWEMQAAVGGRAKVVDYGRIDGKLITPDEITGLVKKEFPYYAWEES